MSYGSTGINKRCALLLFDAASLTIVALIASLAFVEPAYAYVDPSVMTYTIQALAGVAVALSAVAGAAFRRSRRAIMKALNIDENANKQKDPAWVRIESSEGNINRDSSALDSGENAQRQPDAKAKARVKALSGGTDGLKWPARFAISLIVAAFCSFTLCIIAPFEIVAGARGDIAFGIGDIWFPLTAFAIVGALVLALIGSFLPKKLFTPVVSFVFAVGLCCYVQAMFLNEGIPQADGREVDWWGVYSSQMVVSAIIWGVLIVGVTVFGALKQRMARVTVAALSVALVLVQCVGVIALLTDADAVEGPKNITEAGLFEVSDKNNVIVFILDYYDTQTLKEVVELEPTLLDEMEGFTWYQNSAGTMIPTGFALPYLMTGQTPDKGQDVNDFLVTRWTEGHYLEDLKASGSSVGVYTATFGIEYLTNEQAEAEIFSNLDNALSPNLAINNLGTIKVLLKAALYRDAPWALKSRFRFYTDDVNQRVIAVPDNQAPEDKVYVLDDAKYYERLKAFGLTIENSSSNNGAFRMIHLNGGHFPFNLDENGNYIAGGTTEQQQAIGSMGMVSYYIQQMKELGVYDDATFIITADHGDWQASPDLPEMATSPIMLVKNPHAGHDPVKISQAPVSHEDLFAHVLHALGQDAEGFSQKTFDSYAEDEKRVRDFVYITTGEGAYIKSLLGYTIDGDVLDFNNWTFTGEVWPCDFLNA